MNSDFQKDHAVVRLDSTVDQKSIFSLCDAIDLCVDYYQYPTIVIQIDSPGGEIRYLDFYIQRLSAWQKKATIVTLALAGASSAAAYILALGNRREAFASSSILFHTTRVVVGEQSVLTAHAADKISRDMRSHDSRLAERIVNEVIKTYQRDGKRKCEGGEGSKMQHHRIRLEKINTVLGNASMGEEERLKKLCVLYEQMFDRDEPLSARLAQSYYLIDEVRE